MSDEKPKPDAETFLHENMRSRRSRVVESAWRKPEPDESPEERAGCFGGLVSQELHALRSLTWSGVRLVREAA